MAATVASLGSAFTTTAGNKTITATPTVGDLIVVVAASTGVAPTVSDNGTGGTYTQVDSTRTGFSTSGNLRIYIRDNLVSAASSTVYTSTQTSSTGGGLVVLRVTGMSLTGAAAVRSSGGQSTVAAGTPAPVLSLTPLSSNPIITAMANSTSSSTTNVVQRTGYTEDFDNGYNTPATGLEVSHLNSGETSATLTYGGATGSQFASIAIELAFDTAPTVALDTPANTATGVSTTPDLAFTGTDADSDTIEYEVQVDTANTFDTPAVADSYSETNKDFMNALQISGAGSPSAIGQSFTGNGGILSSVKFFLANSGTPSGNAVAYIYAHTGTYGTSSLPTGASLATSDNFDISTTTTTPTLYQLNFSGSNRITLTNGTNYVVVFDVSGAVANTVTIGRDGSSPTHSGNEMYYQAGTWHILNTQDLCFYVNTGTLLDKLSATPDDTFTDVTNGADTHPFASGDQVKYTVQAGDTLTASTTYYWRVRGLDPSGSNTNGAWATTRSFTTASGGSTISVSDTATLTESVTLLIPTLFISVTDTATITETATRLVTSFISVSDTATITEVPTLLGTSFISVTDSPAITESQTLIETSFINVSDTVTTTETATPLIPTLLISVTDSTAITETQTLLETSFISRTDSATITETPTVLIAVASDLSVSVSDTATVTETATLLETSFISVSDAATVTESTTLLETSFISKTDSATITEITTPELNSFIAVSDTPTINESKTLLEVSFINVADSPTITETVSVYVPFYLISAADSITVTESILLQDQEGIAILDTASITESVQLAISYSINVSDTATITETATKEVNSFISTSDTATITENTTRLSVSNISVTDSPTITETTSLLIPTLFISVTESITISETFNVFIQVQGAVSVSDTATITETVTLLIPTLFLSVSDSSTITEAVTLDEQVSISLSDNDAVTEATTRLIPELFVSGADSITITESTAQSLTSFINVSDSTGITEAVQVLTAGGTLNISVSDSVHVSEFRKVFIEGTPIIRAPSIIFLTDGHVAVKLGGNVFMPL